MALDPREILRRAKVAGLITGWYPHLYVTDGECSQHFTVIPKDAPSVIYTEAGAIDYCEALLEAGLV